MKILLVPSLLALSLLAVTGASQAQAAESSLSFNVGATTDYRYRGLSQSRLQPAVQSGVDYAHSSGFYAGAWASTIKWVKDTGGDSSVEVDVYGGYKGTMGDLGYDLGLLRYQYPGTSANNTNEVYGALTYGLVTAKYSQSTTNLFGVADSKKSGYLDLSANFNLGSGYSLTPHVGRQTIKNNAGSYTDYSVTVSKDLGDGLSSSVMLVDTNTTAVIGGKDTAKSGVVVGLKYAF